MSWKEGDVRSVGLFIEFTAPLFHHSAWLYSYYTPSHQGRWHTTCLVTLRSGPLGAGFNQKDRDPSAFSFDGQSNKAQSSMTHQSASVRVEEEQRWKQLLQHWPRGENKPVEWCPRTVALAEVTRRGIAALISSKNDNVCCRLTNHTLAKRWSCLQHEVMVPV